MGAIRLVGGIAIFAPARFIVKSFAMERFSLIRERTGRAVVGVDFTGGFVFREKQLALIKADWRAERFVFLEGT